MFRLLTELRQVDARAVRSKLGLRAHLPEDREDECDDAEEAQDDDPNDFQHIRDDHEHGARDATADTRAPRSINFMSRGARRQKADEQNHEAERRHRGRDDHEDYLNRFDPQQLQVKDVIEHDDRQ